VGSVRSHEPALDPSRAGPRGLSRGVRLGRRGTRRLRGHRRHRRWPLLPLHGNEPRLLRARPLASFPQRSPARRRRGLGAPLPGDPPRGGGGALRPRSQRPLLARRRRQRGERRSPRRLPRSAAALDRRARPGVAPRLRILPFPRRPVHHDGPPRPGLRERALEPGGRNRRGTAGRIRPSVRPGLQSLPPRGAGRSRPTCAAPLPERCVGRDRGIPSDRSRAYAIGSIWIWPARGDS